MFGNRKQTVFSIGIGLTLGAAVLLGSYAVIQTHQRKVASTQIEPQVPTPTPTPTPTPDPLRPRTGLLLGYVGGNHDGGLLTDTMILAQADFHQKILTLISIPRDLWVTIPIPSGTEATSSGKINQLFALGTDQRRRAELPAEYQSADGGLLLARDITSQITNLPIDYVLAINQAGLIASLNKLGSIPVTVPYSFTDEFYPIAGEENNPCDRSPEDIASLSASLTGFELEKQFPCRYETLEFAAGPTQLDASTAAKFVRSRHSNVGGSDFGRSQRQQALLTGIKTILSRPTYWLRLPSLLTDLFRNLQSTITASDLIELTPLVSNPEDWKIQSFQLDQKNALWETRSRDRQYILVDRAASGGAELTTTSGWPTVQSVVAAWLTQTPAGGKAGGGLVDEQAP
ncbi:LCP family protein [Candidatus Woesebacteria bacterium]|nr:LCP family protein [Candidatus Woesebacteria bacterium]